MTAAFDVKVEWLEAPGVSTPELAATWARYEIWIADRWSEHNFRGAGDGMSWPDLTVVPEGAVTCTVWSQDHRRSFAPVRFASEGYAVIRAEEAQVALAGIVDRVLERLAESKLPKTQLAEEWDAIAKADHEERDFCKTVARLGLDPYAIDEQLADEVVRIAAGLPDEVADDFFDTADATALDGAAEWARRAISVAERASTKATETLRPLYDAVSSHSIAFNSMANEERPWTIGYAMARQVRNDLGVDSIEQFDTSPWVRLGDVSAPSRGIHGVVTVTRDRCGLVLDSRRLGTLASRFGQARALGRVLIAPGQQRFILSAARGQNEQIAGAFAAELLAPADGIRASLDVLEKYDDAALEAIAKHFKVSPLLIKYQYDNQIATTWQRNVWH